MENKVTTEEVKNMTNDEVKAYADIIRNEAEVERSEGKIKKAARAVKNWMSDHPFITLAIGVATGGVGVFVILLIASAIAGSKSDETYEDDDTSVNTDDSLEIDVEA